MNYYFLVPIIEMIVDWSEIFKSPLWLMRRKNTLMWKAFLTEQRQSDIPRHLYLCFNSDTWVSMSAIQSLLKKVKNHYCFWKKKCPLCTRLSSAIIGNLGIKTNSSCRSISSEKIGHQVTSSRFVVIDYYFIRKYNSLNIKFVNIS